MSNAAVNSTIHAKLAGLRAANQTEDIQLSLLMEHLQQQSVTTPPTVSDATSLPSAITSPTISLLVPDMGALIQQYVAQALAAQNLAAAPAPAQAPCSNNRRNYQPRTMTPRTAR